ncbi:MAG TPA: PspC domain-containing protein, partial [Acidimicrobiales bacterium]|nr:PspC domain-containing protein [Acidimicrobiales bacterium]
MGIDPTVVRIGVVVASLFGGIGVAVYVAGWLFVPLEGEDEAPARRALGDRRSLALATATATAVEVVLVVADLAGVRGPVGW